jgi:hypothetical protein
MTTTRPSFACFVSWLAVVLALLASGVAVGISDMWRATLWMFAEIALALVVSISLALVATFVAAPRTLPFLDQVVSRGLELTAALPMVIACGVVAVIAPIPIPIAVAIVIGVLGGLRCMRVAASAPLDRSTVGSTARVRRTFRLALSRSLLTVAPTVIEQIVGLEAAIAWLGLFDHGWQGGWGERLGQAARRGELARLAAWTLSAVGLSVALKLLSSGYADPRTAASDGENLA